MPPIPPFRGTSFPTIDFEMIFVSKKGWIFFRSNPMGSFSKGPGTREFGEAADPPVGNGETSRKSTWMDV